jgi:hypothetical protein
MGIRGDSSAKNLIEELNALKVKSLCVDAIGVASLESFENGLMSRQLRSRINVDLDAIMQTRVLRVTDHICLLFISSRCSAPHRVC